MMGTILYYIWAMLRDMLPAVPVVLALRLAAIPLRRRKGLATTRWHEAGAVLLMLWVAAVLAQTLNVQSMILALSRGRGLAVSGGFNLVPLLTIRQMAGRVDLTALINLFGNIAVFMPLGLLAPMLWRGCDSVAASVGLGFGLSLFIETFQLFTYRATDVDDLILNTLGALLGFLLWRGLRRLAPGLAARFRLKERETPRG